uniref:Large ribosomal subunit protein bL34m n=3 Tax=Rhodnius TaxID=13248 RepID=A0A4P6D9U4_RHOPR
MPSFITSYLIPLRQFSSNLVSYVDKSPMTLVKRYPWQRHFRISKARCYFPRPNETMRIKKHGWDHRMSTEGGRKVLMNRILKGRHVLSH